MDGWCVALGIVALILSVFILGMYMGWWKKLFGLGCGKGAGASVERTIVPERTARKNADALVKTVSQRRPRFDHVQAEAKLMQARKASALNMNALSQESRRKKF